MTSKQERPGAEAGPEQTFGGVDVQHNENVECWQVGRSFELKLARQRWSFRFVERGDRFWRIKGTISHPDLRPFRCSDEGQPEPHRRVGRKKITLAWDTVRQRLARNNDARTFAANELRKIEAAIAAGGAR